MINRFIQNAGWPRIIIALFLLGLFIAAPFVGVAALPILGDGVAEEHDGNAVGARRDFRELLLVALHPPAGGGLRRGRDGANCGAGGQRGGCEKNGKEKFFHGWRVSEFAS